MSSQDAGPVTGAIETPGAPESGVGAAPAPPCTLVVFGAAGDLTRRLLIPSLYNLALRKLLPDGLRILGVDHHAQDAQAWRSSLGEAMQSFTRDPTAEAYTPSIDQDAWSWLAGRLDYQAGDFQDAATFQALAKSVGDGAAIFYLATAARFFAPLVQGLGGAGLLKEAGGAFRRVIVEKPFGSDLPSAQALNAELLACAREDQIYRIDHFLGKDTVQSIMAIRFANGMFEPTWRREYVDFVEITAAETLGVEARGGFYEGTGALRDMVPNHLFTLLSMVAMDPPTSFDPEDVRAEKSRLARAIRPVPPEDAVRGQYAAGKDERGYRQEPDVDPNSRTETYVALRLFVENWRWAGVPFYLRTGKRLSGRRTEIAIHYKPAPYTIFRDTAAGQTVPNVARILIDPEQGLRTDFSAKVPGPEMRLGRVQTCMLYKDFFQAEPSVGYETLLYDCMMGDATLFQRADAIEASWRAVQPLIDAWRAGGEPEPYAAGGDGPAGAQALLARDGRSWSALT